MKWKYAKSFSYCFNSPTSTVLVLYNETESYIGREQKDKPGESSVSPSEEKREFIANSTPVQEGTKVAHKK